MSKASGCFAEGHRSAQPRGCSRMSTVVDAHRLLADRLERAVPPRAQFDPLGRVLLRGFGTATGTTPNWLIAYLNLSRRARRSGNGVGSTPASHWGGPAQARELLVEIEFSASQAPGPLRAFHFETAEIGAGMADPGQDPHGRGWTRCGWCSARFPRIAAICIEAVALNLKPAVRRRRRPLLGFAAVWGWGDAT